MFSPSLIFGSTCFMHDLSLCRNKCFHVPLNAFFLVILVSKKGQQYYSPYTHCFYMFANVTLFKDTPYFAFPLDSNFFAQVLPIPHLELVLSYVLLDIPLEPINSTPLHQFGITCKHHSPTVVSETMTHLLLQVLHLLRPYQSLPLTYTILIVMVDV